MGKDRLDALTVRLAAENAAPGRRAHRDRRPEIAARTIAQPRRLGDQLVGRRVDVIGELDLDDRPETVGAHPDCDRHHATLGNRCVEYARLAVLLLQSLSDAEDATI